MFLTFFMVHLHKLPRYLSRACLVVLIMNSGRIMAEPITNYDIRAHSSNTSELKSEVFSVFSKQVSETRVNSTLNLTFPVNDETTFTKRLLVDLNLSKSGISDLFILQIGENFIRFAQRIHGIPIFDTSLVILTDGGRKNSAFVGHVYGGTETLPASKLTKDDRQLVIKKVLENFGEEIRNTFDLQNPTHLNAVNVEYRPGDSSGDIGVDSPKLRVSPIWFPLRADSLVRATRVDVFVPGNGAYIFILEDNETRTLLFRKNLQALAKFKYRIFNTHDRVLRPEDGPAPGSPHPQGVPNKFQANFIDSKIIEIESLLKGDPWLQDDATELRGNNCIVGGDTMPPRGLRSNDIVVRTTGTREFDYRFDQSQPVSDTNNVSASLVGAFFLCNWVHDRWYKAGFKETSGNAQFRNYKRGGKGNDPIILEGSSHVGRSNAVMITNPDGWASFLIISDFDRTTPGRSGNHDTMLVIHELGHFLTSRLVGDSTGLANHQGLALSEGWSDFLAIAMTSKPSDTFIDGAFPFGGYIDKAPRFDSNYYYGARRFPYSTDLGKNPLTFKDIASKTITAPISPLHPTSSAPHYAGELWAVLLWEFFVELVQAHGHLLAKERVLEYIIDGLRITPHSPTFVEARDSLLSAIKLRNNNDDKLLWRAFAKRGLGLSAVAPVAHSSNFEGIVESFDVPE